MPKRISIILVLCCIFIVSACASKQIDNANKQTDNKILDKNDSVKLVDATEDIQTLYARRCLNCHAIDLSGEMGEPTNLQKVHTRLSYDEIVNVITHGRELMPAFEQGLTEQEINELAKWLSKQ